MKVRRVLKRLMWGVLIIILIFIVVNLKWVVYGIGQAKGQFSIINNAVPVSELLMDQNSPDSLIDKLHYLDSVKTYAFMGLNMAKSSIYSSIYDQKGQPVMFVVMACEPYALENYEWEIPLAGNFPYLGFFDKQKAIKEWQKIKKLGFDTRIRTVDGWSTLGFLDNPLLSDNLSDPKGNFANLVLHEIAHETVYIRDSTTLNENLASFIADAGTIQMLTEWYGEDSEVFKEYKNSVMDYDMFSKHIIKGAENLQILYNQFPHNLAETDKKRQKKEMISSIIAGLDTISFNYPDIYVSAFKDSLPNNSFFMSFVRYRSSLGEFYDTLNNKFNGDLPAYIEYMKTW